MYRVLVVAERIMVRDWLGMVIERSRKFILAASFANTESAQKFLTRHKVDLLLMEMGPENGEDILKLTASSKKEFPDRNIILMTDYPIRSWLKRSKEMGADAFRFMEDEPEPLLQTMERIMRGEKYFPSEVPTVKIGNAVNHDFSDRELEVLRELLTGDGNIEIGDRMGIRPDTVNFHIKSMLQKTGFHTRTQLAVEARGRGIIV